MAANQLPSRYPHSEQRDWKSQLKSFAVCYLLILLADLMSWRTYRHFSWRVTLIISFVFSTFFIFAIPWFSRRRRCFSGRSVPPSNPLLDSWVPHVRFSGCEFKVNFTLAQNPQATGNFRLPAVSIYKCNSYSNKTTNTPITFSSPAS
jgi:hypothetical protein